MSNKKGRSSKAFILNVPAKRNICCASRNIFSSQARLPFGSRRVCFTSSYNGYVGIVAAVQEFEINLWVKDKYDRIKTTCRERTGEAWMEAKNVNARKRKRLLTRMKCMFVGSKDSSTRNLEAMLYSRGENKQLSYPTHRGLTYLTRTEKMVFSVGNGKPLHRFSFLSRFILQSNL